MKITTKVVNFTLRRPFTISRSRRDSAAVIQVTVEKDGKIGIGECSPTARYGESLESVLAQIEQLQGNTFDRTSLQALLPAGAARNALDCALWDAESEDFPFGFSLPDHIQTAMTVSINTPEAMAAEATIYADQGASLIKVKLNAEQVFERLSMVRAAAPDATLIVDANEAWTDLDIAATLQQIAPLNIAMVEQPLPAGQDDALINIVSPIPLCADESCHTAEDIDNLIGKYQMVNIKLDKTGGLTAAFALAQAARAEGMHVMVGCMLGSSVAMRAALPVAANAVLVDLDGAFLIKDDVADGLTYQRGKIVLNAAP